MMPDGKNLLWFVIFIILAWAFSFPEDVGRWVNSFEHGRTGSIAASE